MSQSFLLGETVLFIPGRNLLIAAEDEPTQLTLSNPASQCLLLLIQHHGQVVEREHFFQQVWLNNGAQVTNNNFYQNISLLRRAFKEFGLNDDFIITVPKVGIRLAQELPVECRASAPVESPLPLESSPPVETPVLASPVPKRRRHRAWPVFAGVALVGLMGIFLVWRSEFSPGMQQFVPLGQSGECRLYGNPDVVDHARHRQFVQQNHPDCQGYSWLYLTMYPNVQRVSVLRCRQQYAAGRDNQCTVSYYLKGQSYADS